MSSKNKATATKEEAKPALVPKLRFPEFRGERGWNSTSLGELAEIVTGKTPSTKDGALWGGEILFVTPTDIADGEKYQYRTQRTVIKTKGTKVLPPGSVVYTCIASIGKMALTVVPSISNQQINAVVPNGKTAREFIYYSLANLTPWIKSIPATSTLPIINKTQFSGFIIPHPEDKAEQQKIAECLSSVDELIAAQAQKVDALKTHKNGLMQQLIPREGESQPRLRFPEFQNAGEWESTPVEELIVTVTPPKKLQTSDYQPEGDFPIVDQSQAYICGWTNDGEAVIDKGLPVIVFGDHTCALKFIDQPFAQGADGIKIFRPKTGFDIRFFFFALEADPLAQESYKRHFSMLKEKKLFYPAPESGEQKRIASCLSSLDVMVAAETQKLEALKTHKKSLMQQLFPSPQEVEA